MEFITFVATFGLHDVCSYGLAFMTFVATFGLHDPSEGLITRKLDSNYLTFQDFFSLSITDGTINGDLFVTADSKSPNSVISL